MKFLNLFVLLLSTLTLSNRAGCEGDGTEFQAFLAGPPDLVAGMLIVHEYFGISEATKLSAQHLADLGYR
jgi:dienelactone hydrolase